MGGSQTQPRHALWRVGSLSDHARQKPQFVPLGLA
jgi:hypothetical protein